MGNSNKAEIVITALDKASAVLTRIGEKFDSITKPVGRVHEAVSKFSDATGFGKMQSAVGGLTEKLKGLATASVGLGVGYSVALGGMIAMAHKAAEAIDQVGDLASRYGVATQDIQVFGGFVEEAGGSVEDASKAIGKLNKNMSLARAGSKEMQAAFATANITLQDLRTKTPAEVLFKMAEAAKVSQKEGAKLATLEALMGKSGSIMLDTLNKGGDELRERYQQMTADGALYTAEQIAQADAFDKSWRRMSRTVESVRNSMGMKLANAIQPLVDRMQAWVVANRAMLESKVDKFAAALPGVLTDVLDVFQALWGIALKLGGAFKALKEAIGPTNAVLAVLAPILAPVVLAVGQVVFAFGRFAWILGNGLFIMLPKLIGLIRLVGVAFMTNPILLAIGLIAAGAYLLWRNWDTVVGWLKAAWQTLGEVAMGTVQAVLAIWSGIGEALIAVFTGDWAKLGQIVQGALDIIKQWFPGLYDAFTAVWDRITAWLTEKLQALTSMLPSWLTGGSINVSATVPPPAGGAGGAGQVIAAGSPQRQEVGGRIQIEVVGAQAKVTDMRSNNPNVPLDVLAGQYAFY
ncbi:hypothetical protein ACI2VK_24545 [Ralstonia nicotianae]|nr:hypothetical protein [Ralstonia solanacearum]